MSQYSNMTDAELPIAAEGPNSEGVLRLIAREASWRNIAAQEEVKRLKKWMEYFQSTYTDTVGFMASRALAGDKCPLEGVRK